MEKIDILGIGITNDPENKILEYVAKILLEKKKKVSIFTPNPEIIMLAQKDIEFKKIVNSSDIALPDGVGVVVGSRFVGKPIQARITGVDFMLKLCELAQKLASEDAERTVMTGFLGGQEGVAERASECLREKYPNIGIGFVGKTWDEKLLKASHIDILFVAFGAPNQEKWIYENLPKIPVTIAMGVGGSFDFISGKVMRAPKIIRLFGLEWLFRLIIQPWRWRRQLQLLHFSRLILSKAVGDRLKIKKK